MTSFTANALVTGRAIPRLPNHRRARGIDIFYLREIPPSLRISHRTQSLKQLARMLAYRANVPAAKDLYPGRPGAVQASLDRGTVVIMNHLRKHGRTRRGLGAKHDCDDELVHMRRDTLIAPSLAIGRGVLY